MSGSNYRDIVAWQRAVDLVISIYEITEHFPSREQYGLTGQMCRAAISAPSNLAEGRGRGSHRDFRRFLLSARGSLYELETQVEIAERLGYITPAIAQRLEEAITNTLRPLNGLIRVTTDARTSRAASRTRR
jgi:four helix bundle protein